MAYSEKVIDHYENPRNVGSFDKGDDSVGTGMVGAPACGDVMKLQIKVNPDTGAEELALPPVKIHCSILAEDAIKAAVNDYKARHGAAATAAAA